jgi:hypothetical protein
MTLDEVFDAANDFLRKTKGDDWVVYGCRGTYGDVEVCEYCRKNDSSWNHDDPVICVNRETGECSYSDTETLGIGAVTA